MTSDAKVGLFLGLIFIFIIAFVINGLPSLRDNADNSDLTANMVHSQNDRVGIGTGQRKITHEIITAAKSTGKSSDNTEFFPTVKQEIRHETTLPLPKKVVTQSEITPKPAEAAIARKPGKKVISNKKARSAFHIVRDGESLSSIAKKFYGDKQGNKQASVLRIFQANRKTLKSPNAIYVGQKLIIPSLSEKVNSIGRKGLSANKPKPQRKGVYIVRENDSLWRIAERQLGNGSRYNEIARLNANALDDDDSLTTGMRLKMPAR